jgi:glycine cleavage system H protein
LPLPALPAGGRNSRLQRSRMIDYLEATYDKFTFRVRARLRYSRDDVWARADGGRVTVGVTDFLQRRSGDVALVELPAVGDHLAAGEPCCTVETIKAAVDVPSPVTGVVVAVNAELEARPELINEEPYGRGWLFLAEPADPAVFETGLMDAQAYYDWMVSRLEEEAGKLGH